MILYDIKNLNLSFSGEFPAFVAIKISEFRNIGPGNKGLFPGPCYDQATNFIIVDRAGNTS
jgi:hypothetical protein